MTVNMHEAKTHFSRLVERALAGERFVIARNGTEVVELTPIHAAGQRRVAGLASGKGHIREDFDDPLPDEIAAEFQ